MTKYTKSEVEEATQKLKTLLKPGDVVYSLLTHRSRSGMSRRFRLFIARNNEIEDITFWAGRVMGWSLNDDHELRVSGTGMDMGFHTVYSLSNHLFPDGYQCTGKDENTHTYCKSNDHSNGDRDYSPHLHRSGGYALIQKHL